MFFSILVVAASHLEVLMGEAGGTEVLYYETELARTINERLNDPNQAVERPFYRYPSPWLDWFSLFPSMNEEADVTISD